jgi:hypothetical protein
MLPGSRALMLPDKDAAVRSRSVPCSDHSGPHDGVDDVVSTAFSSSLLPLPCPLLSVYRLLHLALSPNELFAISVSSSLGFSKQVSQR